MAKDREIKARLPDELKQAIASASAAHFQTESEFVRQAIIARLKSVGQIKDAVAA
jgi:predicted DNA-binding protein